MWSTVGLVFHFGALLMLRKIKCYLNLAFVPLICFVLYRCDGKRRHEEQRDAELARCAFMQAEAEVRAIHQLEEQRRTMFRNVLHDLKQPVQMVDSSIQLMHQGENMTEHLERVVSVFRLLLDNMKHLSENANAPNAPKAVDVLHIVEQTTLTLRAAHPHLIVDCAYTDLSSSGARLVLTDEHILCRALWNICLPPTAACLGAGILGGDGDGARRQLHRHQVEHLPGRPQREELGEEGGERIQR